MSKVSAYFEEVRKAILGVKPEEVQGLIEAIKRMRAVRGSIYLIGNGGSLTTAAHFGLDLRKYARIPNVIVPSAPEMMSALGNDLTFAHVFSWHLSDMAETDLLVAFSFSAKSENVRQAFGVASMKRAGRILITGPRDGDRITLLSVATSSICVPSENIRVVEDVHLAIAHAVAQTLKEELWASQPYS